MKNSKNYNIRIKEYNIVAHYELSLKEQQITKCILYVPSNKESLSTRSLSK